MFNFGQEDNEELPVRPSLEFPDSFEIGMSTNDPGLNITEVIYYDNKAKKLRMQIYYSILGLDKTKGFDIVLDEADKMVAVQTDSDCKKTQFTDSLLPVQLFFQMFESLTEYLGTDDQGLHIFKVR